MVVADRISDATKENRGSSRDFPTIQLFGLRVHAISEARLQDVVLKNACGGHGLSATYATAHTLALIRGDAVFRDAVNTFDICYVDGCGVGITSLLLRHRFIRKTTANRYFLPLCRRATAAGLRIALVGGRPGVADKVAERIRDFDPHAQIWTCHGFCSTERMTNLNGFEAHIVFLAMGQPKQEYIALELSAKLPRSVIICVGGLFDVVAGELPLCPEWIRSGGMEWAFRLVTRPRQVWRRYLLGLPVLAAMVAAEKVKPLPSARKLSATKRFNHNHLREIAAQRHSGVADEAD